MSSCPTCEIIRGLNRDILPRVALFTGKPHGAAGVHYPSC
jgi:putative tryptophan/tyrosine transport system substrate-binding protein